MKGAGLSAPCVSNGTVGLRHYYICYNTLYERHIDSIGKFAISKSSSMTTLKLTAIGSSTGVIIPKEMLARMNVAKGDALYVVEAPDGSYRLTPYDPAFARKLEKADEIMRRYRNTLHTLAK